MKMCEYANNLLDMSLLVYLSNKNRKIVYEGKDIGGSLLIVDVEYASIEMVLPKVYRRLKFLDLGKMPGWMGFMDAYVKELRLNIYYD
ncbi:MAG: hypothetical protein ACP5JU_03795 [Minisyncoccia bacterium]